MRILNTFKYVTAHSQLDNIICTQIFAITLFLHIIFLEITVQIKSDHKPHVEFEISTTKIKTLTT